MNDKLEEIDYADYEVTEDDVQWLIAELRRARRKEQQYRAMLQVAAPAVLALLDAEVVE
jgi:hypothetical protein